MEVTPMPLAFYKVPSAFFEQDLLSVFPTANYWGGWECSPIPGGPEWEWRKL